VLLYNYCFGCRHFDRLPDWQGRELCGARLAIEASGEIFSLYRRDLSTSFLASQALKVTVPKIRTN